MFFPFFIFCTRVIVTLWETVYTNFDTDEYVEFKVDIESAVRKYAYDPEFPDCDCFDDYPTKEDFE